MPITLPTVFARCIPAQGTTVKQCGTVTQCQAIVPEADELNSIYTDGTNYRVLGPMLQSDMEAKMCSYQINSLYDFLMANKVNMNKQLKGVSEKVSSGLFNVKPFINVKQYSPINNAFWNVSNGQASGSNWQVDIRAANGTPMDIRWFNVGDHVYIQGVTGGGTKTITSYVVASAGLISSTVVRAILTPQNAGTLGPSSRAANTATGILQRGVPNKNPYESYCQESPGVINWNLFPQWMAWTRWQYCSDELYEKWRGLLMTGNPLYKEYGDLDAIALNAQQAMDFQKKWVNSFFFEKPISTSQTINTFHDLEDIQSFSSTVVDIGGARCIGKRANVIGVYEQLYDCGQVYDVQGGQLNLLAMLESMYYIARIRKDAGNANPSVIDWFTSSMYAEKINDAFIGYFITKSQSTVRTNTDVSTPGPSGKQPQMAPFGFRWRSYMPDWPAVTINVISHEYFDDFETDATLAGQSNIGRMVWVLDFSSIYPAILESERRENMTGDINVVSQVSAEASCYMRLPTTKRTHHAMLWAVIVECTKGSMIIENMSSAIPNYTSQGSTHYPPVSTTTTATTT